MMIHDFKRKIIRYLVSLVISITMTLVFLTPTSFSFEIQALPGSSWGEISYDDDRLVGGGAIGHINQGIDWITLPGDFTLNTFVEFRYRFRSENKRFYNVFGEAIGVQLKKRYFDIGINYLWERFPNLVGNSNNVQYYLNWYYGWDLEGKISLSDQLNILGLPGNSWGEISYEDNSLTGAGAIGHIN